MRMTGTGLAALAVAAMVPAASAASLAQETDINDALFEIAVANEIRKECDSISPRIFTAIGRMNALKAEARRRGYSNAEIDAYVNDKAEKQKMRARRNEYIRAQGAVPDDGPSLCALGESEISKQSRIGALLVAR
ncbi:hypothetical protein C6W92_11620 [Roseovarius sp. A46]|uniref:DUF5333 domain-containing protein n=1 Tax=Roseovarius sp. A46 TaxID=2109331 RepID=UPI001011178F|nr:DUF5333 domain-containing protein [Roseovarius sp. A46]RXV62146.1 hypothetical protein C6W92_11620 [Roseovarius sp. A46]